MLSEQLMVTIGETPSTNDEVRAWLTADAAHGCSLLALRQTAGRGRRGRSWTTVGKENLHLSVGLRDPRLQRHLPRIPLAAGVATCLVLDPGNAHGLALKWPNDLVVGRHKLGGILCEGASASNRIDAAVVGIGLNLLGRHEDIPDDLADLATTWQIVTGESANLQDTARRIRHRLLQTVEALLDNPATVLDAWRSRDALLGHPVHATLDGEDITGTASGINDDGALLIDTGTGEPVAIRAGTVRRTDPV